MQFLVFYLHLQEIPVPWYLADL